MKRTIITFIILLGILYNINAQSPDTIKIPTPVAKQIAKDLVSEDSAKSELRLTQQELFLVIQQSTLKDNAIKDYQTSGLLYEQRLENEKKKYNTQSLYVNKLEKNNKKLKSKLIFTKIVGISITGFLGYLYISK
jgi:hypothetical protein